MSAHYTTHLSDFDRECLVTVQGFREDVRRGFLIDYDGFGHPVRDGMMDESRVIYPSEVGDIPKNATHIAWYNR